MWECIDTCIYFPFSACGNRVIHVTYLCFFELAENGKFRGSLMGISIGAVTKTGTVTGMQKIWRNLQALGDIAFAYSYSIILIEIQAFYLNHPISIPSKYITKYWPSDMLLAFFFTGHCQVPSSRKQDHEEGHFAEHCCHNNILLVMWLHGLCSLWRWCPLQPTNWFRFL